MTPEDRTDLIEEAQKRLAVLEEYAPKMMSEDEIKASDHIRSCILVSMLLQQRIKVRS